MRPPQRLHRQRDPRVRRLLTLALAGALALVVTGVSVVGLRVQQVHLGYRLDTLQAERSRLEVLFRQLEVEVATLRSPGRVAARARELGLNPPAPQQVRLAREFVAGNTGLAAAERNRVASLGDLPRSETVVRSPLGP
jgi:cell division protein FtsL